jgi:hypothetical protein
VDAAEKTRVNQTVVMLLLGAMLLLPVLTMHAYARYYVTPAPEASDCVQRGGSRA